MNTQSENELPPPTAVRRRLDRLSSRRELLVQQRNQEEQRKQPFARTLELAADVTRSLELLSEQLFRQVIELVERSLTDALQEVLEQPIQLKAETRFQNNVSSVRFSIVRDGQEEDVYRGQGGSVANILSIGLRMFAISNLDESQHRRFLVLDEQDCWLQPQLVPRLVTIVRQAAQQLGFQVLMISHHDVELFEGSADRIYTFAPQADGSVQVKLRDLPPLETD
ncbi:MAG: DNA repair protein [Pirellulaceae bacterium]